LQIHLPSKERKLKTIQPDNCEPFEKTVAAVIAKLRENKDERVRSKNYKQFKAWNDRLIELSVYLEIPKAYFGYSTKTRGVLWGPMTIQLDGMSGGELLEMRLLDKKWNRSFFTVEHST
jgi:hypothetical protein